MNKLLNPLLIILILIGVISVALQAGATDLQPDQLKDDETDEKSEDDDSKDKDSDDDSGKDSDNDGVDDEKEEKTERKLEVKHENDKFEVKSELKSGESKDVFEVHFELETDNEAEIELKYKSEVETSTSENETELKYKVKFDEIIEFVDTGLPGFQDEDPVSSYEIGNSGWEDLDVNYDESTGFLQINATTSDGVFGLTMTLSSTFLKKDNATISPNSLKIDVLINDFPLAQNDTKLAIEAKIKTESKLEVKDKTAEEEEGIAEKETEVEVSAGDHTGYFSWAEFAIVDGNTVDVITSSLADASDEEGEKSSKIFFTFDAVNPKNIFWDPKLGVISQGALNNLGQLNSGLLALPVPWLAIAMSLVAVPVLRRRRLIA